MKLDKIRFAQLIGYIQRQYAISFNPGELRDIDDLIYVEMPATEAVRADPGEIETLLRLMSRGTEKIEAIKSFRRITGQGLKESKDAVERYWVSNRDEQPPTLSDILGKVGKN